MPMSSSDLPNLGSGQPIPKIDPLFKMKRLDTAENLRQKAETLRLYHGDHVAFQDYNLAADAVEAGGHKNYGEWEQSVLGKLNMTREQMVDHLKVVEGPDWDDPLIDWEDDGGTA